MPAAMRYLVTSLPAVFTLSHRLSMSWLVSVGRALKLSPFAKISSLG